MAKCVNDHFYSYQVSLKQLVFIIWKSLHSIHLQGKFSKKVNNQCFDEPFSWRSIKCINVTHIDLIHFHIPRRANHMELIKLDISNALLKRKRVSMNCRIHSRIFIYVQCFFLVGILIEKDLSSPFWAHFLIFWEYFQTKWTFSPPIHVFYPHKQIRIIPYPYTIHKWWDSVQPSFNFCWYSHCALFVNIRSYQRR